MRGGPSLKGKGGLVGFRKSLKVQGSTCSFSNIKEVLLFFRISRNYFYFFECQESTFRLSKNLLSIKRGFSKAFFKPYFLKKTPYFLIISRKNIKSYT